MFEALFKCVSTRFGLRKIEKSVENLDFIFCYSFQNLRLGSIDFTKIQTHPSEKRNASSCHHITCVCIIVNPSCKYCTKIQTHCFEKATHRHIIVMPSRAFVLLNPSCKDFTKIQTHPSENKTILQPCGEHKLRNFKASYLTMKKTIREYSNLGKIAHLNSTKSK